MNRSGFQRLIPIILVIIVVIVAVAALISLGRTMFGGGDEQASPLATSTAVSGKKALVNTTGEYSVKMTWRGPITADENFRSYAISVANDARNMTTYKGYVGTQIDAVTLDNNNDAYTQFVYALDRAKLMDGTPLNDDENDTRGICATGSVYEFAVMQGTKTIQKLWTSTCRGSLGSLTANLAQVNRLFQQQIPTYSSLNQKMLRNS